MKKENIEDLIAYRMGKAWETFSAAKLLAENSFYNSSINRLYYACFYALNALFIKNGIIVHSHAGVRNQLSNHFIKTNKLDKSFGKTYSELFDFRQKGDYVDLFDIKESELKPLFEKVEEFIKKIESLIDGD